VDGEAPRQLVRPRLGGQQLQFRLGPILHAATPRAAAPLVGRTLWPSVTCAGERYSTSDLFDLLRPELHPFATSDHVLESYRAALAGPRADDQADGRRTTFSRLLQLNPET
jgi:hypothetical protein